ncbi:Glycosyltransferase involved in cell wall bisynthesis [Pollutimonas bauzanensis]|uniref:Glycosyltransferase involved in cell wall bisynthesis n=2 Tax=Pollutimonas bauzanensis TaxID=658167 RepID=A0A1M5PTV2_9BURK|nr:glycosyltransferase [Pollutimonas bauzanensis]SHH04949.1 Glycosyltransferase involved in cell wall bisynthesis [Pollutimonas bauzanensis]
MSDYADTNPGPLQVVHIISGLGHGGAETVLHRLLTAPTQPDRHCVISMGDEGVFGPRLRAAGVAVYTLDMKTPAGALKGLWRLHRLLRQLNPDVVQTWMYHADLIGGLAARLAGIKAVAWGIRNSGADLQKSSRSAKALSWLCARLSRLVPGVIVACADNAAQRHRQWGYRADRMLVIPNGYDLSCWQPDEQARAELRAEWGWAGEAGVIGSVARWNPLKDHANLLAAFALSAARDPSLRCVLIGHGMDASNEALMALINGHGIAGKVKLLGRRDDVPRLMNALDLHVLSSRAEGFPNVVAEAMATGVACVVTDVGDAARIVGDAGWVAPPQNPAALSEAMDQAVAQLGTAQMRERLRQGRERVGRLFSLEAMVDAYHVVWRRLAQDYPRRPGPAMDASYSGAGGGRAGRPRRLLFVVNNPAFFLSHRLPLALGAQRAGFEVHVATMDGPSVPQIVEHGLAHHVIPMSRSGKHPVQETQSIYALWRLFRRLRPDVVHAVTIKPVLYGGIAARLAGVPAYVAAISGLGFVFTKRGQGLDFLRLAATLLYRLALGHPNSRVIFQNVNDRDVLRKAGVVRPEQVVLIRGSGVDLNEFQAVPEPDGPPVAIMAARLLRDKGAVEFVEAARLAAGHAGGLRWVLAGGPDAGNPASVSEEEFARWQREGVVECLGERSDIAALYQQSHIAVLPSYREGLPRSLVEAAACGRAVVTTDVPGCRDAIEPGVSGLLVPVRNARALADAVMRLAGDAQLRHQMGEAGRRLAEREFDIRKIVQTHVDLYEMLSDG